MKKLITAVLAAAIISLSFISTPVFAAADTESCECQLGGRTYSGTKPKTSILGNSACDCSKDGGPSAIENILRLVVDIMTIGIGILAAVGITIVGIQYLTAGSSEEKTKKAKRRLIEIIIGIVVYVVLYAALKFLIPGFSG